MCFLHIMAKITRTGGRGTSSTKVDSDEKSNWAGDEFKEYQEKRKDETGDETVVTGRGTSSVNVDDVPETDTPGDEVKSKVTNRGTHQNSDDCDCSH